MNDREKLLTIIANAYQIAGAHDAPEHILDVLADPEAATDAQVEAMLPYQPEGAHRVIVDEAIVKQWLENKSEVHRLMLTRMPVRQEVMDTLNWAVGFLYQYSEIGKAELVREAVNALMVPIPVAWDEAQRVCDLPGVDEAIRNLLNDQTNDNAVCMVRSILEAAAPAAPAPEGWININDRLPLFGENMRVLIYTEGYDFIGEQFFDVPADNLNEAFFEHPDDMPEVCRHATHWTLRPDVRAMLAAAPQPVAAQVSEPESQLLGWAIERWTDEVANRPLINVYRRTLDSTWRQVIRYAGGDDVLLVGPRHDDLVAAAAHPQAVQDKGDDK